jgi:hypothetical protein
MDLMRGQIVRDDDVAWPQLGNERLFDIGEKGLAVHWAVEDHGRSDAVVTQPGGEGGGFPVAMGDGGATSLAPWLAPGRTTIKARHLGVGGGLVDEDDARRIEIELPLEPGLAWPAFTALRRCSAACAVFFCA